MDYIDDHNCTLFYSSVSILDFFDLNDPTLFLGKQWFKHKWLSGKHTIVSRLGFPNLSKRPAVTFVSQVRLCFSAI